MKRDINHTVHRPLDAEPAGAAVPPAPAHRSWGRHVVGAFFLTMGGVHLGIVAADPTLYQHFADAGLFGFVRNGWQDVFMAHPAVWGLSLMAGEVGLGTLLLLGGRATSIGWVGVMGFHVLLMLLGFGFWVWSVPALLVLRILARRDVESAPTSLRRRDREPSRISNRSTAPRPSRPTRSAWRT